MDSSEKVFSGGRSNCSQTCSLLSQYLKEKGSFGDLTLDLIPNLAAEPKESMYLWPNIDETESMYLWPNIDAADQSPAAGILDVQLNKVAAGEEETQNKSYLSSSTENGQMTIFYAGQVLLFNDFPAEKAKEIMILARQPSAAFAPPDLCPAESATSTPAARHHPQPVLASYLPIARKNSLARFLEKRRDRITAKVPYQASKQAGY